MGVADGRARRATEPGRIVVACGALAMLALAPSQGRAVQAQVPTLDSTDAEHALAAMADYLVRDGGRWRAANPGHDPARPTSPTHFGLWFSTGAEGRLLELRIVSFVADSAVVTASGRWYWHPGRQEVGYAMMTRGGALYEGTTTFPDPRTFRTVTSVFRLDGSQGGHRDDNVLVGADHHRTTSFQPDESGGWSESGTFDWIRETRRPADLTPALPSTRLPTGSPGRAPR